MIMRQLHLLWVYLIKLVTQTQRLKTFTLHSHLLAFNPLSPNGVNAEEKTPGLIITTKNQRYPENSTSRWTSDKVGFDLNPEAFQAFINGLIPGFRFKEFIAQEEAETISIAIRAHIREYKTAKGVGRAGATYVEHPKDFGEYAQYSAILRDRNISIPYRLELADKITSYLARNTDYDFRPLRSGRIEFFWGLFRQINTGAGWHLDDVTKDGKIFKSRKSIFQGSVVLHIKTPKIGGETIIADRRAQKGDKKFRNPKPDDWTYVSEMFEGISKAEVPAVAGDLIVLSTLNYHTVQPCREEGAERISFSMFIVIFADQPKVIYYYN